MNEFIVDQVLNIDLCKIRAVKTFKNKRPKIINIMVNKTKEKLL